MAEGKRRMLVTAALPYANGRIHLGHLVEYIQTDIWVRFQNLRGHECRYFCADDTHGTPVMLAARAQGAAPEALVERMNAEHRRDFAAFHIRFDNYYSTHSPEDRALAEKFYREMKAKGHIARREVEQLYCPKDEMFLPDRFIRGTCPFEDCGAPDQYGDSCEACGRTYQPTDLKEPACATCGTPPVKRKSEHLFFKLGDFEDRLKDWVGGGHVQPEVKNKLEEWFREGLRDWDISRDAPYFGFEIPEMPGKYFYVWLDAPIGYMASAENWARERGQTLADWWQDEDVEIHHFIGKDILYFHTLFWPAMLMAAGFRTPTRVHVHGFLTVDGQKMSKTRGTFIQAGTYPAFLDPQYLRYYYACKLGPDVGDIDLNFQDFTSRINADLVGNVVNLGARAGTMLAKHFQGRLAKVPADARGLLDEIRAGAADVAADFEARQFGRAMRRICALSDKANQYAEEQKPWAALKEADPAARERAAGALTAMLNAFRCLVIYLKPVLPRLAAAVEKFLQVEPLGWSDLETLLEDHQAGKFQHLIKRVDPKKIEAMIAAGREEPVAKKQERKKGKRMPEITIDDFARTDLRVARIKEAAEVPGADKLLKLVLDLGDEERTAFAGIRGHYRPEELPGRQVLVVANLKPRQMKFGTSEAMILAAVDKKGKVILVGPDQDRGAEAGMKVQ